MYCTGAPSGDARSTSMCVDLTFLNRHAQTFKMTLLALLVLAPATSSHHLRKLPKSCGFDRWTFQSRYVKALGSAKDSFMGC
jgi:hypothetical protein